MKPKCKTVIVSYQPHHPDSEEKAQTQMNGLIEDGFSTFHITNTKEMVSIIFVKCEKNESVIESPVSVGGN